MAASAGRHSGLSAESGRRETASRTLAPRGPESVGLGWVRRISARVRCISRADEKRSWGSFASAQWTTSTMASGRSLLARVPNATDLADIQQACKHDDLEARAAVHYVARAVRVAIGQLFERYGISFVTLGGGVLEAVPALWQALSPLCDPADETQPCAPRVRVERSTLGDFSGIIGAAHVASSRECSQGACA